MKIKQFDIWIADLNPTMGTEAGKVRPVLIVQTDLLNGEHPSTLICPITSMVQPGTEILRVHIIKGMAKLKEDCDIIIDKVRSIDNMRLQKKIGTIPAEMEETVKRNLKIVLDL
jgi:mRNA interferase MazF